MPPPRRSGSALILRPPSLPMSLPTLIPSLAEELGLAIDPVRRTLELFDQGNTLPFVARYRKEVTGGLDEVQLRTLRDRAAYLRKLEERRRVILASIDDQGRLDPELETTIRTAQTRPELEDLYLPFRPKRRTKATLAADRGLGPLADAIWNGEVDDAGARRMAGTFVDPDKEVPDVDAALAGARHILAERVAEDPGLRGWIRQTIRARANVRASAARGKKKTPSKFQDYYDYSEPATRIPSHRILAIRRGEAEGFLRWTLEGPEEEILAGIERHVRSDRIAHREMAEVARDAWTRLLGPSIESEVKDELRSRAEEEAIDIFGENLEQLLLAPPAGQQVVIGLDPGFRTGVKAAVTSATGAVLDTTTLYLHRADDFARGIRTWLARYAPRFVAVGNGTASRETEAAVRGALKEHPGNTRPDVVVVSESGASVYSASEVAREELPELDVSLRGAVSIARRLQDPLAELVKIDPKSIGVGQYQHDVNPGRLRERLDEVVQICVNRVGVELNTASVSLLAHVSGIGPVLARRIVELREERGGFRSRKELLDVPRLGKKAFEQSAGFLRIRDAKHPLDRTAVHPERYVLVETIARDMRTSLERLLENDAALSEVDPGRYVTDNVGLPTLRDILEELRKPGRDPRDQFEAPTFRDDVHTLDDLEEGMKLEGIVTNVVAFGAFVDVGVHDDGLVHVSKLADRYVKDPHEVVRVGQRVRVTVVSVDRDRKRIGLSMREGG